MIVPTFNAGNLLAPRRSFNYPIAVSAFDFFSILENMSPVQTIRIRGLETRCHVGVPDAERAEAQRLLLDIEFDVAVGEPDDIAATVDYFAVGEVAREVAQARPRHLIETVARDVADTIRGRFPIQNLRVRVRKFSVPGIGEVSAEVGER